VLTVNEIFFSIQGEGTRAGRPSAFLRLTGCPLRCAWCDTAYAFYEGWEVVIETSGHVPTVALDPRACVILDVKAPGSGESRRMDWSNVERLRASDEAKFVIDGRADYEWSRQVVRERRLAERATVLFSPVHGVLDGGELGRWILEDGLPVRLQLQLHRYLWPKETRGV
jgi:7-carboxy-7-deazaguanine synthase